MLVAGLGMNRMTAAAETGSASGVPETADPEAGPGHELILQGNRYKPSELYERAVILNTEASEGADSQEKEISVNVKVPSSLVPGAAGGGRNTGIQYFGRRKRGRP